MDLRAATTERFPARRAARAVFGENSVVGNNKSVRVGHRCVINVYCLLFINVQYVVLVMFF